MVEIIANANSDFLTEIKEIFCFGCGKRFHEFIDKYPNVNISGIIDNYRNGKNIIVQDQTISVLSLDEYAEKYSDDSIIIITPDDYEEIVEKLDSEIRLDGIQCYLASLFNCNDENDKHNIMRFIEKHNKGEKEDSHFSLKNKTSSIKRFQIWDCMGKGYNAGSKAPNDVMNIAGSLGYQRIDIHPWRGSHIDSAESWSIERNKHDWEKCFEAIPNNSVLFLQHPFWQYQEAREHNIMRLKFEKNVKVISFVHDVEELRKDYYNAEMQHEFKFMLECADLFIVHNGMMKRFFIEKGIKAYKIIELGIFDYLCEPIYVRNFEKSVTIAGNLDPSKGRFIESLDELPNVKFHLFGSGYPIKACPENVEYHGSFHTDEIAGTLCGGFGLIWNGDSLDVCDGSMGNYLRYNSPHKLSLYLAAGMPVIIWAEAAAAEFVREHGVGITVSSLRELPGVLSGMTEDRYNELVKNIAPISKKLRSGTYTKQAIENAERILEMGEGK